MTDDCYQIYIFGDIENMGHNFSGMDYYQGEYAMMGNSRGGRQAFQTIDITVDT